MEQALATSRYTFRVLTSEGYALFHASTGSVFKVDGPDAEEISTLLSGDRRLIPPGTLDEQLTARLRRNGFLVEPGFDEVAVVRERYWAARGSAPVVLLVTTTMDCNLGCYYCYESRTPDALRLTDAETLVDIAAQRLGGRKRSLHVDWYGGEPMLGIDFLERGSLALQEYCRSAGIRYHASIISNGTRWPDDPGTFVARHRIREVQISFDGMKDNHDRRRRYRPEHRSPADRSSFEQAAALVDELVRHTRVDLRYNADQGNAGDLPAFISFAKARGWFDGPFRCVLMVAKLSAYSERSSFLRPHELDPERFEELQALAARELPPEAQDDQDIVSGFPHPKTSVCGALAHDSAVVGADGLEYRCGLQVGEPGRATGRFLGMPGARPGDPTESFPDRSWWAGFDPTTLPTCSRCSFLPVCWGGCPKRHLDGDGTAIRSEGRFWRANLPRMVAAGFADQVAEGFEFTEAEQFRGGLPAEDPCDSRH